MLRLPINMARNAASNIGSSAGSEGKRRTITITTDMTKLAKHLNLCRKNLKSSRVKVCAECPFEDIIIQYHPELAELFEAKRRQMEKPRREGN